jgi:hypothetical protein
MDEQIASDARWVTLAKVRQARKMSAASKLQAGWDLFDEACRWALAGIVNQYPDIDETQCRQMLRRRFNATKHARP